MTVHCHDCPFSSQVFCQWQRLIVGWTTCFIDYFLVMKCEKVKRGWKERDKKTSTSTQHRLPEKRSGVELLSCLRSCCCNFLFLLFCVERQGDPLFVTLESAQYCWWSHWRCCCRFDDSTVVVDVVVVVVAAVVFVVVVVVIGCPQKKYSIKMKKNAQKNEDGFAESWKFGTCATTS